MKPPFPYFGGKRLIAATVWERLGQPAVYAEPFAGSLAVLLARPDWTADSTTIETVNDIDGMIANAWRAILHDPEQTAHRADWPVNENDVTARHAWLVEQRPALVARLEGDPDFYDAKIAGWWIYGMACWIGSGFCSGKGSWHSVESADGERQLVHLGNAGRGVQRQLVHLGNAGRGVQRQAGTSGGLTQWLCSLSERLRRVRVCCGDWSRILTPAALAGCVPGSRAIFLDPPYSAEAGRGGDLYAHDSGTVAHEVREWCMAAPADYRIALCGYAGEGHEILTGAGWQFVAWQAQGGYGLQSDGVGANNRKRERIWFSPACLRVAQGELFSEVGR